jgi:hypothetical protein
MEPVNGGLEKVSITEMPSLREGFAFRFRGVRMDDEGNELSDFVDIELTIPPLNFPALRKVQTKIAQMQLNASDPASMDTVVECLWLALRRNYRGVPRWLIEASVDLGNLSDSMLAFMAQSGLIRKANGLGEAIAAEDSPTPTGTVSTAT